jgi:hypothetical protein
MAEHPQSPMRVFVGADRSQLLAVRVLEHSIKRYTDADVVVRSMHDVELPDPKDIRQGKRTGFSFTRFAIPELCGYQGRAIYLDADMQVFRDFRELWNIPFDGAKVIIQEELPEKAQVKKAGKPAKRIKQCSVMLLDCDALKWNPREIIAGLDGKYTYEDLMFYLCILAPDEIKYGVPFEWNSLECYEPGRTGLIHYTDMSTQPWVCPNNKNGYVWLNEVRMMLKDGSLSQDELRQEVELGYFRPSLPVEIEDGPQDRAPSEAEVARYAKIDRDAGYVPHREANEMRRRREQAIRDYVASLGGMAAAVSAPGGWARNVVSTIRRQIPRLMGG